MRVVHKSMLLVVCIGVRTAGAAGATAPTKNFGEAPNMDRTQNLGERESYKSIGLGLIFRKNHLRPKP